MAMPEGMAESDFLPDAHTVIDWFTALNPYEANGPLLRIEDENYRVVKGKVTKLTNFGVFVELEPGLEGLLHISELADHKVDSPEEVVKVGDEIEVKVLRVDAADRKIGLSRKRLDAGPETTDADATEGPRRERERGLRGGTGSASGQLFRIPEASQPEAPASDTTEAP